MHVHFTNLLKIVTHEHTSQKCVALHVIYDLLSVCMYSGGHKGPQTPPSVVKYRVEMSRWLAHFSPLSIEHKPHIKSFNKPATCGLSPFLGILLNCKDSSKTNEIPSSDFKVWFIAFFEISFPSSSAYAKFSELRKTFSGFRNNNFSDMIWYFS